ncbi:MAG TPA: hypothetical protein VIT20_07370 [Propionibacteriaceae bacterium]
MNSAAGFAWVADLVDSRLDAGQRARVERAIERDPVLQADEAWLRGFVTTARSAELVDASALVEQSLLQYFDRWVQAQAVLGAIILRYRAALTFDSSQERVLAGVRGDSTTATTMVFTSEVGDLVLDLHPTATGRVRMLGQVLLADETNAPVFHASVLPTGEPVQTTESDAFGRFRLNDLATETVELTVNNGEVEVRARVPLEHIGRS